MPVIGSVEAKILSHITKDAKKARDIADSIGDYRISPNVVNIVCLRFKKQEKLIEGRVSVKFGATTCYVRTWSK